MTVLPESPVREYLERVDRLLVDELRDMPDDPAAFVQGFACGISEARYIVAKEAPEPGQETTRFEYQAVGVDDGGSPERSGWLDSYDKARSVRLDWETASPPFDDMYIKRRTVTVTEPVRLDPDGEPIL
jgi:hypothetical protein